MDLEKLESVFINEPAYRLKQAKRSLFVDLIEDWKEALVLPLPLREKLNEDCPIGIDAEIFFTEDKNTIKIALKLNDGAVIESVLMKHKDSRNTVCVFSQVGCPLNCSFCATGKLGFKRNLAQYEILEQVLFFSRYLKKDPPATLRKQSVAMRAGKVSNIVFMGMGEPFLNYENVLGVIRILNGKEAFNIGARHISISTSGIIEGIEKLAEEKIQVNLAISLHAPDDELRSRLMPVNEKSPLEGVLKSVDDYIIKTKRRVMFEYLLIKDVNDFDSCVNKLAKIMKRPLCFVNLISYNPTGVFVPSPSWRIEQFKEILEKEGVHTTRRYRFGQNIKAACDQLASSALSGDEDDFGL